ncbi:MULTISPECIES: hypothetical protein [unclassified Psychrobacter]|uniref:hypothetical protein n=1 Tax=unclassified Psychrobacter TaxID=196806 RepID=UPI000868D7AA|nr:MULTISPECIES: hypothetical protein [unclassified Psychrobacter]OEH68216.1 MAG: hypothetical protein BAX61_05360 [Psychrobacter sp. B29-1]PKG67621.1 hypothetical protein CXF56_02405 [Psychrobacter sp. Choline-02u-13]PKH48808.1 hypothetical protein CXF69_10965 [Psychrobacter sp. Choline-02u-9]|tara:strand:- start:4357 stop:5994 length:1638 start_codon:yes stop_codon:yes gene_type:complete
MNIIDQLEKTVTPAVMGNDDSNNVAYVSLLEQFYAVLAARLAVPQVYSQLLRTDQVITSSNNESPLFEQIWQDKSLQETIVQELSATHHIDEQTTEQLLISAAPLAYRELKVLANGQFLPAFLQDKQAALRPYLPIWAAAVITATQGVSQQIQTSFNSDDGHIPAHVPVSDDISNKLDDATLDTGIVAPITNTDVESIEQISTVERANTEALDDNTIASSDAIHANPAAYHLAENSNLKHAQVRTRNQRNDLLIRVFLLIVALAALALAAWALLVKPNNEIPVEPVATAPVEPPPAPVPPVPTTTPVELIVGVDNGGNLYTCSATVGDAALQSTLQQALNTSFGEQASICELNIQDGVATTIANMPAETLPNVLTMLRSTPFARLHVQNDRLTLEAPDNMLLQRLVTEVRNLAPTMVVESTAPLPLPDNSNIGDATNNMANANNQFVDDGAGINNQLNNNGVNSNSGEYQASDDDTGDRVIPTPLPNNNNSFNNAPNNLPTNGASNIPNNFPSNNQTTRPPGPFSPSEVDEMANTVIVAEPAQVR